MDPGIAELQLILAADKKWDSEILFRFLRALLLLFVFLITDFDIGIVHLGDSVVK